MKNEFYFQMGHGHLGMIPELINLGVADGVILSPRDVEFDRCKKFVEDVRKIKSDLKIIFDPQFYFPHFDHKNLSSYPYYLDNFETTDFSTNSSKREEFHIKLGDTQQAFNPDILLTPAIYREAFSLENFSECLDLANEFRETVETKAKPVYLSLPFHVRTLLDSNYFNRILSLVTNYDYDGIYLILELDNEEKFLWTNNANMYIVLAAFWR